MTILRNEVRDARGDVLTNWSHEYPGLPLHPVDRVAFAAKLLRTIRRNGCPREAYSFHFFWGGEEIGSWSIDRDHVEVVA
jgi:hypothetical protein